MSTETMVIHDPPVERVFFGWPWAVAAEFGPHLVGCQLDRGQAPEDVPDNAEWGIIPAHCRMMIQSGSKAHAMAALPLFAAMVNDGCIVCDSTISRAMSDAAEVLRATSPARPMTCYEVTHTVTIVQRIWAEAEDEHGFEAASLDRRTSIDGDDWVVTVREVTDAEPGEDDLCIPGEEEDAVCLDELTYRIVRASK